MIAPKKDNTYLSDLSLSCYLPHLEHWPFQNGDKITFNLDNGNDVMTVFTVVFGGNEWTAEQGSFSFNFNKHGKSVERIQVDIKFARN